MNQTSECLAEIFYFPCSEDQVNDSYNQVPCDWFYTETPFGSEAATDSWFYQGN